MITLLHNSNCSKSNCALDYRLQFPSLDIQIRPYLSDPLSETELSELVGKLKGQVKSILRNSDSGFAKLYGDKPLDEKTIIHFLAAHPSYLQRPILVLDNEVIVGRPPELILDKLKELAKK